MAPCLERRAFSLGVWVLMYASVSEKLGEDVVGVKQRGKELSL